MIRKGDKLRHSAIWLERTRARSDQAPLKDRRYVATSDERKGCVTVKRTDVIRKTNDRFSADFLELDE